MVFGAHNIQKGIFVETLFSGALPTGLSHHVGNKMI